METKATNERKIARAAIWSIAALLLALSLPSHAVTGNELLSWCRPMLKERPPITFDMGRCIGYIGGLFDGVETAIATVAARADLPYGAYEKARLFCTPERVTVGQLIRMSVQRLEERPEVLHERASLILTPYFAEKFPCASK